MDKNSTDITKMPYAQWLEEALRRVSILPTRTLAILGITEDGDTYIDYYNASMGDKLLLAGLIQQDAMLNTLEANGIIKSEDGYEEDDDGKEE
jgi:hypothetical protein